MLQARFVTVSGAWALVAVLFLALMACATPGDGDKPLPPETGTIIPDAADFGPSLGLRQPDPEIGWPVSLELAVSRAGTVAVSVDPMGIVVKVPAGGVNPASSDPLPLVVEVASRGAIAQSSDPEPSPSPSAEPEPIQVSKEVFNQTFTEVEALIKNLNGLIKARDYSGWTRYLSADYIKRMSEAENLRQMSQSATLQKNNIVLKSLNDYFINVVVPSRANLRLDDLVFLSENVVEAIMIVGNRRVTVYRLIKIDNQWMIGLS